MGGKGGGGSSSPTTLQSPNNPQPTVSSSFPNPLAQQAYTDLLNRATSTANQPLQQYSGPLVAGFNPQQQQAFTNAGATAGANQPYTQQAGSLIASSATPSLGQLPGATQSLYSPYASSVAGATQTLMNPYLQSAVGSTAAQMENLFGQQQNQLTGQAIGAGAYGGDRAGIAAGNLANQQGLAFGQTIGGLENQGYQQAQALANQGYQGAQAAGLNALSADAWRQASAGSALGALGQTDLNSLLTTGGMQQQLAQEQTNIPYEQFVQQQAYPFQTTGWLGNLVEGLGSQMGGASQTLAAGPNTLGQVGGLGLAGVGALGQAGVFNPTGGAQRGGRIHKAPGGSLAGGYSDYMPSIPDVSISYVPGGENSVSGRGAGSGAPPAPNASTSNLYGGIGGTGVTDAELVGAAKLGKRGYDWATQSTPQSDPAAWTNDVGQTLNADGTVIGGYTAATGLTDAQALEGLALEGVNRGGRIKRDVGGLVPDVSTAATSMMDTGASPAARGPGASIPPAPHMLQGPATPDTSSGGDNTGQQVMQGIMMAAEIAALLNRGGRVHKNAGGSLSFPSVTIPNPDYTIAYAPAGYVPGPIATGKPGVESSTISAMPPPPPPAAPPINPDPMGFQGMTKTGMYMGAPFEYSPTGGARHGGRIVHPAHYDDGGAVQSLAPPDMASMAGSPMMQQMAQRYANLPADQLESLDTTTQGPQHQQIHQALMAKRMLPSYTPPQTATPSSAPSQNAFGQSAFGLPGATIGGAPSSLGGAVSPLSAGTDFAGGGLVPHMADGGDLDPADLSLVPDQEPFGIMTPSTRPYLLPQFSSERADTSADWTTKPRHEIAAGDVPSTWTRPSRVVAEPGPRLVGETDEPAHNYRVGRAHNVNSDTSENGTPLDIPGAARAVGRFVRDLPSKASPPAPSALGTPADPWAPAPIGVAKGERGLDAPAASPDMPPVVGLGDETPLPRFAASESDLPGAAPGAPAPMSAGAPQTLAPSRPGVGTPATSGAPPARAPGLGMPRAAVPRAGGATDTLVPNTTPQSKPEPEKAPSESRPTDLTGGYREKGFTPPEKHANWWAALTNAGLGMMASHNPSLLGALGEGGIRGLTAYAATAKSDESALESAKKLHGETERYARQFAAQQARAVAQTEHEHRLEDKADQAERGRQLIEARRERDTAASRELTERRLDIMEQRGESGTWMPWEVADPTDSTGTKRKSVLLNNKTKEIFDPGMHFVGKPGTGSQTFAKQWAYNAWLDSHPDDKTGALEYARGTRVMAPAQMENSASLMAKRELDIAMSDPKTTPKNPTEFYTAAKNAALQRFREHEAGVQGASSAPAPASQPQYTREKPFVPKTDQELEAFKKTAPKGSVVQMPPGTVINGADVSGKQFTF